MSGQPNRYAADAAKFRQEYMNSLDLRSALDDQVLQAVKVYKQTGQLPAISSLPDNRTSEERLKDIESLKAKIISELKPIGSPQFALEVLQRIQRSPLNSDGSLFTFFAQRVTGIVKNLKESYTLGIKGDTNDVERLVATIEDLYSKDKSMSTTTKSYFDRPSNTTAGGISADDLNTLRSQYASIIAKISSKYNVLLPGVASIQEKYNALFDLLNTDFLKRFKSEVINQGLANIPAGMMAPAHMGVLYDAYNRYNELLTHLPSASKLGALQQQLEKAAINDNGDLRNQILQKIDEQLPSLNAIQHVHDSIAAYTVFHGPAGADVRMGYVPRVDAPIAPAVVGHGINQEKRRRGRPKGCGIKIPFTEKVDRSQGVQASPRYISFGKHVINKKKLGDGILSIRTKSGANIATTPVKHISQNMKIVVDKIIGGAIPSYEELSRLTEEEKSYLHKVSKQADILDKFSIPAPSKDQEEKEIHEYEVMRGEIMSGNDNKELIKKFKLLIIKLSRRSALPKKEVSDILSELVELGY